MALSTRENRNITKAEIQKIHSK